MALLVVTGLAQARLPESKGIICDQNRDDLKMFSSQVLETLNKDTVEATEAPPIALPQKHAAIFGKDDRSLPDITRYPFSAMPKLIAVHGKMANSCSSTMISACHIVTASHCFPQNLGEFAIVMPNEKKIYSADKIQIREFKREKDFLRRDVNNGDIAFIKVKGNPGKNNYVSLMRAQGYQLDELDRQATVRKGFCQPGTLSAAGYHGDIRKDRRRSSRREEGPFRNPSL